MYEYHIEGGFPIKGTVHASGNKNAALPCIAATLLTKDPVILRNIPDIEDTSVMLSILQALGIGVEKIDDHAWKLDAAHISSSEIPAQLSQKIRASILFAGPLVARTGKAIMPPPGGDVIGRRRLDTHFLALQELGARISTGSKFEFSTNKLVGADIFLDEASVTATENAIMAAALYPGNTTIVGASPNYMVQDVCFYLQTLGVQIDGVGTTNITVHGLKKISRDVEYAPAEDPIEAISFVAAGVATKSEIEIKRVPIEFLEIEFEVLRSMGQKMKFSEEYLSENGRSRLVDVKLLKSNLKAPIDKIHPMPFPGLNIDSLPFFSLIAATAEGRTMIHDWVFENRAIYSTELTNLNAKVELLDAHRIFITGPTNWRPAEMMAPPALRPAVVIMLAMLAAPGESILRNVYSIARGYEDFANRLRSLGADIEPLSDI